MEVLHPISKFPFLPSPCLYVCPQSHSLWLAFLLSNKDLRSLHGTKDFPLSPVTSFLCAVVDVGSIPTRRFGEAVSVV